MKNTAMCLGKSIEGYDNYLIFLTGEIYGNCRKRFLSPVPNNWGYLRVELSKNGEQITKMVHRLVVEAHIGKIPSGKVVNHKDGNKQNNNLNNLEVVTASENERHAVKNGFAFHKHGYGSLLQKTISGDIVAQHGTTRDAARTMNCHQSSICKSIALGRKCKGYIFQWEKQ
jgi:hypothetical protein